MIKWHVRVPSPRLQAACVHSRIEAIKSVLLRGVELIIGSVPPSTRQRLDPSYCSYPQVPNNSLPPGQQQADFRPNFRIVELKGQESGDRFRHQFMGCSLTLHECAMKNWTCLCTSLSPSALTIGIHFKVQQTTIYTRPKRCREHR